MIKTLAFAALAGALTMAAAPSLATAASPDPLVQRETVRYGDLNLATAHGASTLNQRLTSAARRVCDDHLSSKVDIWAHRRAQACQEAAVARARSFVSANRAGPVQWAAQ